MFERTRAWRIAAVVAMAFSGVAKAEVRLPAVLSDHMVLQQGMPIHLWGWAAAGEAVQVSYAGQAVKTHAGPQGHWNLWLEPLMPGDHGLLVVQGANELTVRDILVEEVWVASGQSNMERALHFVPDYDRVAAQAANQKLRFFIVDHASANAPAEDVRGNWQVASAKNVKNLTGTGYFFAKELQAVHGFPVGLMETAFGGTQIESWLPSRVLSADPRFAFVEERWKQVLAKMPALQAEYDANLAKWKATLTDQQQKQFAAGQALPGAPVQPRGAGSRNEPASLWNGMVAPIAPYTIRGILWYQGENNATDPTESRVYGDLFDSLIRAWRAAWAEGDVPFLYAQLSRYKWGLNYAILRESQAQALSLAKTAMVVTVDQGMIEDVHYPNKRPVGHRLFLAADAMVYGGTAPFESPRLRSVTRQDSSLRLWFTGADGGLRLHPSAIPVFADKTAATPPESIADGKAVSSRQPTLSELSDAFLIAGQDGIFQPAMARVQGDSLILSNAGVSDPIDVCYAFRDDAPATVLWNGAGLPASPFRASLSAGRVPACPPSHAPAKP